MCTLLFFFFFFNDTAPTEIYPLSLHDALPIPPGVACTVRGIPSSSGRAGAPAGVKLVVSIHTVRPGGGRNCGAMRAVYTKRLESGPPPVAAIRKCATVSSGSGNQAIHAPFGSTGTDCPLMPRCTGPPAPPRTEPNRNSESWDWMISVTAG